MRGMAPLDRRREEAGRRPLADRAWREWAVALASGAAAIGLIALVVEFRTTGTALFGDPGWDRHLYLEMARRDVLDFRVAPYCWRVLGPFLAKVLPGDLQAGFAGVTVVSLVAAGPALYWLARGTGASRAASLAVVPLYYSLGWGARYQLSDFWVPDAPGFALTVLTAGMVIRKHWVAAAVTIAVGVLVKESVVFAGVLAYSWHVRSWRDWRTVVRAAVVVAPGAAVLGAVRVAIRQANGDASYLGSLPREIGQFPELFPRYSYGERYRVIFVEQRWEHLRWADFDIYLGDPFGVPLLALAAAGVVAAPGRAARLLPFLALAYTQLLFATDTQRLLVLGFVALGILAAGGADWTARRAGPPTGWVLAFCWAVFGVSLMDAPGFGSGLIRQSVLTGAGMAAAMAIRRTGLRGAVPGPRPVPPIQS